MKQIWKRSMSLLLSGVLLLSNFPLAALATEETTFPTETTVVETQPVETEPVQTQPAETQPVVTVLENTAEVANDGATGSTDPRSYPVSVNGLPLNEENANNVTDDSIKGKVSYADGVLKLEGAEIKAEAPHVAIKATDSLTIHLEGENVIDGGAAIAIEAAKDLTITGNGSLQVKTANPTAIKVEGFDEGENKKGLTIDGVQVSVETTHHQSNEKPEMPVGIDSANGVVIKGAAHFKTTHTKPEQKYDISAGYAKKNDETDFGEVTADEDITANGGPVEFIDEKHVGEWQSADGKHYKSCNQSTCALITGTKILLHPINQETTYKPIGTKQHQEIYACCDAVKEGKTSEDHDLQYTSDGTSITASCNVCDADGTITLTAENAEYTGGAYNGASYGTPSGVLTDAEPKITYTDDAIENDTAVEQAPTAIGRYTAHMTLGEKTVEKKFAITNISLSDATVTVAGAYTYNGSEQKPGLDKITVTLKNGTELTPTTHYTITGYSNNINASAEGTKATVTVTAAEGSNYTGSATGEFTIAPKAIVAGDVKLGSTLTYNGSEQEQTVVPDVAEGQTSNVTFEVINNKQTNAKEGYELTVKGTGNYGGEVKLPYSIAKATPQVTAKAAQTVAIGSCNFEEPVFIGVGNQPIPGEVKYTYGSETNLNSYAAIRERLNTNLTVDGQEQEIGYTFVPTTPGNYLDTEFTGKIKLTAKTVSFKLSDNNIITDAAINGGGSHIYGVTVPVSTANIKASGGLTEGTTEGEYKVIYTKEGASTPETADLLPVGRYNFKITYSGTVGGVYCKDYPVHTGSSVIVIEPKPIAITTPAGKLLVAAKNEDNTPKAFDLMDAVVVTDPASGAVVEYKVDGQGYATTIPKASAIGRYKVEYKITAANYETKTGYVWTTIQPELTATYGDTLADVEGVPTDGKWVWALNNTALAQDKLSEHKVGPYGINDGFQMVYNNSDAFTVKINVAAKPVTDPIIDVDTNIHYDDRASVAVKVYDPMDATKDNDNVEIPAIEYEAKIDEIASRTGWTTITVRDKKEDGNYVITTKTKDVLLYRPYHVAFSTLQSDDDLKETEFDTVAKVKTELSSKIKANEYPEDIMKYFKIMMTYDNTPTDGKENWIASRELDKYYPKGGFTYVIPYSVIGTGLTADNDFKMSVMDAGTSDELETEAGTPAVEITDFEKTERGIKFHYDGYSVVCIAPKVDLTKTYAIKTSIIYDGKTSTKGSLSIKVDNKTASAATYGQSVEITAEANSGYSIQSVKVTDSNSQTVTTDQSGSKYTFKMPASDVTVKLTLKKTTSNTKNPGSGDTSNIHLWLAILASSAVGIVALVIFWFKKRRK